jgi:hypothetical protein
VVQSITVKGPSVSFVAVELMMSKFDLTLGAGGILQDAALDLITDRPVTNNSFRVFTELSAAASMGSD